MTVLISQCVRIKEDGSEECVSQTILAITPREDMYVVGGGVV